MELWAEYEGKTIDGVFPLTQLLRPEGTSAFFTTSTRDGLPRVIRLIECKSADSPSPGSLFEDPRPDADDILSRWRGVAALDHPNILKLEDYGQVVVDQTSLVYAVMEPVDANLGEVVGDHLLTLSETRQIAVSLLSVLQALHSHGFVHEHVQPDQVVAVHEVVKLQCDCIRDAPEGLPGQELKKRDVQDLAALILQALTKERTVEAAAATASLPLPAPFNQVVRKGISGEWGLAEIAATFDTAPLHSVGAPPVVTAAAPVAPALAAAPKPTETVAAKIGETSPPNDGFSPEQDQQDIKEEDLSRLTGLVSIAITIGVILIMVFTWQFLPKLPIPPSGSVRQSSAPAPAGNPNSAHPASAAIPVAPPAPSSIAQTTGTVAQWRVIAYKYRHEKQARKKAARIAQKHPQLHPEVFQPNGTGPYLITIGGVMNQKEATALAKKAHHEGLPRNTYAKNYSGETR